MLEKFLSIPNSFGLLWMVLTVLSIVITIVIAKRKKIDWDNALIGWMMFFIIIIVSCFYGATQVEQVNISNYSWKQVYTNDMNAKITLKPIGFFVNSDRQTTLEVGQPLGDKAYLFKVNESNRPNQIYYEIIAQTGDETLTKRVELSKVIVDGEIANTSRITKIEYRPYDGYRQKLNSTTGDIIPALEGSAEIQITIQNDETKKLNDLFDPEK